MLTFAILSFAGAAVFGLILLTAILQSRPTNKAIVGLHGLFAATGLILLIIVVVNNPGSSPTLSLIIFIIAALGGFTLAIRDFLGKPGPKALALIHGSAAVIAFLILLFFVLNMLSVQQQLINQCRYICNIFFLTIFDKNKGAVEVLKRELELIADQLTRAMEGNAWHGPAVLELLSDVNEAEATSRVINNVHSIKELTAHIAAWHKAGIRRINGDPAQLTDEEDWVDVSSTAWDEVMGELKLSYNQLKECILNFDPAKLEQNVPGKEQTYYVLFHGIIQHDLYHAGQIAILKKKLRTT